MRRAAGVEPRLRQEDGMVTLLYAEKPFMSGVGRLLRKSLTLANTGSPLNLLRRIGA